MLPLAIRVCLPALNNNLVNLLKTTTLAYAIAVPETLYAIKQIWSESQNVLEMMIVLLATYGILVGVLVWLMHRWERAMHIPGTADDDAARSHVRTALPSCCTAYRVTPTRMAFQIGPLSARCFASDASWLHRRPGAESRPTTLSPWT